MNRDEFDTFIVLFQEWLYDQPDAELSLEDWLEQFTEFVKHHYNPKIMTEEEKEKAEERAEKILDDMLQKISH